MVQLQMELKSSTHDAELVSFTTNEKKEKTIILTCRGLLSAQTENSLHPNDRSPGFLLAVQPCILRLLETSELHVMKSEVVCVPCKDYETETLASAKCSASLTPNCRPKRAGIGTESE